MYWGYACSVFSVPNRFVYLVGWFLLHCETGASKWWQFLWPAAIMGGVRFRTKVETQALGSYLRLADYWSISVFVSFLFEVSDFETPEP